MANVLRPAPSTKSTSFLTGSRYTGGWNPIKHCMEGFGTYIYPDGSEYRGYFVNGLFHGYGQIKLAPPHRMIVVGLFDKGVFIESTKMVFPHGLRFDGASNAKIFNPNEWRYCTNADRRYSTELLFGLTPVGPSSCETRTEPPRKIPEGCYDTEEGIYNPNSGFILGIPPPFKPKRFVVCQNETELIEEHYRKGYPKNCAPEPETAKGWEILKRNIEEMMGLDPNKYCECGDEILRGDLPKNLEPEPFMKALYKRYPICTGEYTSITSEMESESQYDQSVTIDRKDILRNVQRAVDTLFLPGIMTDNHWQTNLIDFRGSNFSAGPDNRRSSEDVAYLKHLAARAGRHMFKAHGNSDTKLLQKN